MKGYICIKISISHIKRILLFSLLALLPSELWGFGTDPVSLKVWDLSFEGELSYEELVLREVIRLEDMGWWDKKFKRDKSIHDFSEIELQKDVIRLERFYQRRGFIHVNVEARVEEGDVWWKRLVTFTIVEGTPLTLTRLQPLVESEQFTEELSNDSELNNALKRRPFQVNRRYEPIREQEMKGILSRILKTKGFPFPKVITEATVDSSALSVDLTVRLQPGPKGYLNDIQVVGLKTVTRRQILKEAELTDGQPYQSKDIDEAQQQLFNHHLYEFVTITLPEQPVDTSISVLIRVQENKLRQLMLRGGFGTDELVRSEVSWAHLNPLGNTNSITIKSRFALNQDAEIRQARLGVDYLIPYVYNTKSSIQISPFTERRNEFSYRLLSVGINNSFLYQYTQNFSSSIAHEYTSNRFAERRTTRVSRDSLRLYNISAIQLSANYRTSFVGNKTGWFINPYLEFSGFLRTGTYYYQKGFFDIRRYQRLNKTTTFAAKVHAGFIFADELEELPIAIRHFAGGTSSVRGWYLDVLGPKRVRFDEEGNFDRFVPTGGRYTLAFSVEIRQKIPWPFKGFGTVAFLDGGQVWRSFSDIDLTSNRFTPEILPGNQTSGLQYGIGGGLSYDSPIGPVRIDVAYKINPTEADLGFYNGQDFGNALNRWGIHLSIGHPF